MMLNRTGSKKEPVVANFKLLSQYMEGGNGKNHENFR
jgi:hypothetical protein